MPGNLTRNKGHHLAVDALSLLPGKRLVIVGDGPMRGELPAGPMQPQSMSRRPRARFTPMAIE